VEGEQEGRQQVGLTQDGVFVVVALWMDDCCWRNEEDDLATFWDISQTSTGCTGGVTGISHHLTEH
jgi:hypothetical protein